MKTSVLILPIVGFTLVYSTPVTENIGKTSSLEVIKTDRVSLFLKDDKIKVKESKAETPKLDDSKLERKKNIVKDDLKLKEELKLKDYLKMRDELKLKNELKLKDELKLKEQIKLKDELKLKDQLKLKDELKLKNQLKLKDGLKLEDELKLEDQLKLKDELKLKDQLKYKDELKLKDQLKLKEELKLENSSDLKLMDRAKKDCRTVPPTPVTPTKFCFEVTPGVQGLMEVCDENLQPVAYPQISQVPQQVQSVQPIQSTQPTQPVQPAQPVQPIQPAQQQHQINYEIPQTVNERPQQVQNPSQQISSVSQSQIVCQVPSPQPQNLMSWTIKTGAEQQNLPSVNPTQPQILQRLVYQDQPQQQFGYTQNLQLGNSQDIPFCNTQSLSSGYPQTLSFGYSQTLPNSHYSLGQDPGIFMEQPRPQDRFLPYLFNLDGQGSFQPDGQGHFQLAGLLPHQEYRQNGGFQFGNLPDFIHSDGPQRGNKGKSGEQVGFYLRNQGGIQTGGFQPGVKEQLPIGGVQPAMQGNLQMSGFQPISQGGVQTGGAQSSNQGGFQNSAFQPPSQGNIQINGFQPVNQGTAQNSGHQPGSQGNLQIGGLQTGNQGGVPIAMQPGIQNVGLQQGLQSLSQPDLTQCIVTHFSGPPGSKFVLHPPEPLTTPIGNTQVFQQQTKQLSTDSSLNVGGRKVQPGPVSRILDLQGSSQMYGPVGTMENSWGPAIIQGNRYSRRSDADQTQLEHSLKFEKTFQPKSSGKNDQSTVKKSSLSLSSSSSSNLRKNASQKVPQTTLAPKNNTNNKNYTFLDPRLYSTTPLFY